MLQIKFLIVDDEIQSRSLIKRLLLSQFPEFKIEEADTVNGALQKINEDTPHLIFLDVQMRGETGFELLDKISAPDFGIIFTTAHSEFAVKAFRYCAMDYLMKPLDPDEFKAAVEKALQKIRASHSSSAQIEYFRQLKSEQKIPDKLTIPTAEGFLFIRFHDILYCQAVSNYTDFHLVNNKKILSSYTLGYYDELLSDYNFFRVHRSYLVNLANIKMYRRGDGGSVVMDNGEEIDVSRSNKEALLKILKL